MANNWHNLQRPGRYCKFSQPIYEALNNPPGLQSTTGFVKASSEIAFQLFLQHLCWRNLFMGGDEGVRGFRTEDTDINI